MGPLPLFVPGDPWISGLPCVGWLWPLVGGKDSLRHALWSSFVPGVSGVLPLAMVEGGGQIGASDALCIRVMGSLFWSVCVVC